MKLESNSNNSAVTRLAKGSVRSNPMRTFFILMAIGLSVSFLMMLGLFNTGFQKAKERKVEGMQHIIYMSTTVDQRAYVEQHPEVQETKLYKGSRGVEIGNIMATLSYIEDTGEQSNMERTQLAEGTVPKQMYDAAVTEQFLEDMGKDGKLQTTFDLTFLDGTTETFTVTGIIKTEGKLSVYPITVSKEYAQNGSQMKDIPFDLLVQIKNARAYNQQQFEEMVYGIGLDCGIERKNMNINNVYADSLPGGTVARQQALASVGVGIGVLLISILVIYSVFYLSVIGRIRQFGQLRTLGATKKQISRMVRREGLILSAVGIPAGLVIGGIIGYFLQPEGWDWKNTILLAFVVTVADVITVLVSVRKPAKTAATVSPIEAAKYVGYKEKNLSKETKYLKRKLSPFNLARLQATRNRKKVILTMVSLGVGGMLFMIGATFITSMSLEGYSRQGEFSIGEFVIPISYNAEETTEHGLIDIQQKNPLSQEFKEQIEEIDGVRAVKAFQELSMQWESHGDMDKESLVGVDKTQMEEMEKYLEEGKLDYEEMISNEEIIICSNGLVKEIYGWEYEVGDPITILAYNGKEEVKKEYTIGAIISGKYRTNHVGVGLYIAPQEVVDELAAGVNLNNFFVVSTDPEKEAQVEETLSAVIDENPLLSLYTLRERKETDKANFDQMYAIILGLSVFVISFSLLNLINTLITNIVTRKQEFAALQSMGMTKKQMNRMIQMEGVILAMGNAVLTLILGTIGGIGMLALLQYVGANYMNYTFPIWFFLGYVAVILLVPVVVTAVILHNFGKQPLVERLRIAD